MSRLTKLVKVTSEHNEYRCYGSNFSNSVYNDFDSNGDYIKGASIDKLGNLEDLEQKLGIDLITLFGLVDKEVYWNDGDLTRKLLVKSFTFVGNKIRVYIVDDGLTMYLPIEDFNRYVFLTEEEAKKHLENINGRS